MHRYLAVIAETPTHPAAAQTGNQAPSRPAVSTGYTPVRDVMTCGVVATHHGATFKEIVQSLARNRIGSVPVIDDDRKVVGMVTESDLLAHMAKGHPSPVLSPHRIGAGRDRRRKEEAELAADLMTSPAEATTPRRRCPIVRSIRTHASARLSDQFRAGCAADRRSERGCSSAGEMGPA